MNTNFTVCECLSDPNFSRSQEFSVTAFAGMLANAIADYDAEQVDELLHEYPHLANTRFPPDEEASGGVRQEAPQPHFDPRDLLIPGGAVPTDTPSYIMRDADEEVLNAVHRKRALVTVRGPRQTGKTSLIMGVYAAMRDEPAKKRQLRTAFIDLQALPHDDLQSLDTI